MLQHHFHLGNRSLWLHVAISVGPQMLPPLLGLGLASLVSSESFELLGGGGKGAHIMPLFFPIVA